jgi:hypothetical protein
VRRRALIPIALVVLAGCGGDDEKDVRSAVDRYVETVHAKDANALCRDHVSQELKRRFKAIGETCESAIDADKAADYRFTTERVWRNGDHAMAIGSSTLEGRREADRMALVREDGRWRLTDVPPEGLDPTMNDAQQAVAKQMFRFAELGRARDTRRICDELASKPLKTELGELGLDCARDYFTKQLEKFPRELSLRVGEVRIKRNYADASGHTGTSGVRIQFVREADGQWRITR